MTASNRQRRSWAIGIGCPQSPVLPRRQANPQSYRCSRAFSKYCLWM